MTTKEHVHNLMTEIGPLMDLGEVVELDALDTWTLGIDETTVVFAQYQAADDRLYLWAEVATPKDAARLAVYERLLAHNRDWAAHQRTRLALDRAGGTIVQITDLGVSGLEVTSLQAAVRGFVDDLGAWRALVADAGIEIQPASHPASIPVSMTL